MRACALRSRPSVHAIFTSPNAFAFGCTPRIERPRRSEGHDTSKLRLPMGWSRVRWVWHLCPGLSTYIEEAGLRR